MKAKRYNSRIYMTVILLLTVSLYAQDTTKVKSQTKAQEKAQNEVQQKMQNNIQHGRNFVDENGDGYNDNAPDHDGDGIPNGLDPDYKRNRIKMQQQELPYIDLNGDGINDNLQFGRKRKKFGRQAAGQNVEPQQSGNQQNTNAQKGRQNGKGRK